MMEISSYNRKKIAILHAVAIMLVLLLHSYFWEAADYPVAQNVQLFTGAYGISGVAVPLFYFISGMLFFKSVNHVKDCFSGINKRFRSILIPYVIWNIVFVLWYLLMSYIPGISGFINSDILGRFNLNAPIASLDFLLFEPAGFHLWFLRDLMLYVLVSPVIYVVCKRFPLVSIFLFFVLSGWTNRCGLTYYAVGAIVAMHYEVDVFDKGLFDNIVVKYLLLLLFLAKCLMTMLPSCNAVMNNPYFQQIANMAGILSVWWIYDVLYNSYSVASFEGVFLRISKYSFFIYLFHEPALNIIKKMGLFLLGVNNATLVVLYLISPIIMCAVSVVVAKFLQKLMPRIYGVLVGGR